ncbi:glycosyltransferase family 2 protein [Comamonas aquatica]|uniref:glycosyltransferase family 2 protein n=1 Tax=Comamonas aquatica TaxID=225991 RepID=UPI0024489244|nr:glycosyltransferase family 2 protein [Comamonas aquatica]MDH0493836.1 glycosyltransferase [Comamonas aquatica]
MTQQPLLSICIPTYNRAGFLRECLSSLDLAELDDVVEIVVSDNASTDTTLDVLEEFKTTLPLRYIVQQKNLGPDRNFDAVITEAHGEYCWLLGSDDVVEPGGVSALVSALSSLQVDIVQFGYVQANLQLQHLFRVSPPAGIIDATPKSLTAYLAAQPNMSMVFTFISAYAFRRSVWIERQKNILTWAGTFYIQMFAMHSALVAGASLAAIEDCLVVARGGNPNEINSVPGRFVALDSQTVKKLVGELYDDNPQIWRALGEPFRRSYPGKTLISITASGGLKYIEESQDALLRLGYSKMLLDSLRLIERLNLLPTIRWLLKIYRQTIKKIKN